MALVREVDALDDVPEWAKAGYKQVGEKWVNDDVEDVGALKGALKKEREGRELTAKELAAFKNLGMSPDQIAEIKAKAASSPDKDVDKLIEKRVAEAKKEFEPVVAERDALKTENRKLKLTDKVRADFIAAGGLEEEADDVVRLTEGRFDLGDKGKIVVLDDEGDPTGQSPKEWFEKIYKKAKPGRFKGSNASGSGARGGDGGSGSNADLEKLPPEERLAEARRRGISK